MRKIEIEWDEESIQHIAEHDVTADEVEEVIQDRHLFLVGKRGTYYILGRSESGRYLFIVLSPVKKDIYEVITARPMTDKERKRFRKKVILK